MAFDHEYYENLDSHPTTDERETDFDVIASQADWLKKFYNGDPDCEQVKGVTPGRVYHIHRVEPLGDVADYYFIDDNGEEQGLGSFFFEAYEDSCKKCGYMENGKCERSMSCPCESCKEPTKKPAGFWDGHKSGKRVGGRLYFCDNTRCKHYRKLDDSDAVTVAKAINQKNGIDIKKLRDRIHATHNTYGSVAQLLGVGPAQVSKWLNEQEAMSKETYDYLVHLLSKS